MAPLRQRQREHARASRTTDEALLLTLLLVCLACTAAFAVGLVADGVTMPHLLATAMSAGSAGVVALCYRRLRNRCVAKGKL